MGWRGGRTDGAADCRTDSLDPAASQSPKGLPRLKEVPVAVPVQRGKGSTRLAAWWPSASGLWGRPRGPMEMHAGRSIADTPIGPVTTEI
jgi:hypothetical protein